MTLQVNIIESIYTSSIIDCTITKYHCIVFALTRIPLIINLKEVRYLVSL